MSFSKIDLEKIKNKILLSGEIEKKTKLTKKGNDYWCCCPFHKEKTPSFKINDNLGSFYCFGCGAKGDLFTLYTDLYNYSFQDAVKELSQKADIDIEFKDYKKTKQENVVKEILKLSCEWFQNNLYNQDALHCREYLKLRNLTKDTISKFKLGYSFNSKSTLYEHLKIKSFNEEEIIKSNVTKIDKNNKIKDYFYKRLIFPIMDENDNVVGFGGRALDNSNPKYINSPESYFFHKRNLLYNLSNAKYVARKKNNLLICEGYIDVISLYQNGIQSVVAPLGTALTEEQLNLAWKYSSKPSIMFDGDKAGLHASYKSAIMALHLITSKRFLQFIILDEGYDPDSFINTFSFERFVGIIKKPQPLINFIFNQSSGAVSFNNADEKVSYDKYLDELIETIKDKKIKYFYKNEFKSLFFSKIKQLRDEVANKINIPKKIDSSLYKKQVLSFIASSINHKSVRKKIISELLKTDLYDQIYKDFLDELEKISLYSEDNNVIINYFKEDKYKKILNECLDSSIYQIFPYASAKYDDEKSYQEVKESCQNLNTRLLKLKKINKSLDSFVNNSNQLNWEELQKMNFELSNDTD